MCDEDMELRRGPWTLEEDKLLIHYIACHGEGRWNLLARCSGTACLQEKAASLNSLHVSGVCDSFLIYSRLIHRLEENRQELSA